MAIIAALDTDDGSPRTELDSHADSPVVGSNVAIINYTGKYMNVSGFTENLGECKSIPVVDCAIAYDCTHQNKTYILRINNALYIKEMKVNLIPPFLMRLNGIKIDECPKFLATDPNDNTHSIFMEEYDIRIPLNLIGIISYFPSRKPERSEITNDQMIDLTPRYDDWDPHDKTYRDQEDSMVDFEGKIRPNKQLNQHSDDLRGDECHHQVSCTILSQVSNMLNVGELYRKIKGLGVSSVVSKDSRGSVIAEELSELWGISKERAEKTLHSTTQLMRRIPGHPSLTRRYKTNDRMIRYKRINTNIFMDTYFSAVKSTRGNTCAQLFVSEFNHVRIHPMKTRKEGVPHALKEYFKNVGVPKAIICDGAAEQVQGESRRICNQVSTKIKQLERDTPWANRAELFIRIVKNDIRRDMKKSNSPMKLWDYCAERRARIINSTYTDHARLNGMVPHTKMTGQPCDISEIAEFGWYEWVYYRDEPLGFPHPFEHLGRCLGPAENVGSAMSQWIMDIKGNVIPRQTFRKLTPSEIKSPIEEKKRVNFDDEVKSRHGDSINLPEDDINKLKDDQETVGRIDNELIYEVEDHPDLDQYINSIVRLPMNDETISNGIVISRDKRQNGMIYGKYNQNPLLDTRLYNVQFDDGTIKQYTANQISQNIHTNIDSEGDTHNRIEYILDHRKSGKAVKRESMEDDNKAKTIRRTTKGWYFNVRWGDGTESWEKLKDIKDSNPIEVAEYCFKNKLMDEPAISWWAPHIISKRNQVISKIKTRYRVANHKYGVLVPRNIDEAYQIDNSNGDNLWRNAIAKEMGNIMVAFRILEEGERAPPGYTKIECNLIFDVKMDFTRKARYVGRGDKVPKPLNSTYAGVVSRESVRIALAYAALNDLEVISADIMCAYLQAPCTEKYYIICGPEFGTENIGKHSIVVRSLYGTAAAGRDFRDHLRDCMWHMKYQPCHADPDLWMRQGIRDNGEEYWEYMLLYVDDALAIQEHAKRAIDELGKYFQIKEGSVGPPKLYLGGKISMVQLPNGVEAYAISTSRYVQEAVKNVENYVRQTNIEMPKRASTPMKNGYKPELDITPELSPTQAAYYQSLIGILRWTVELGRVDICCEVSMLASHVVLPRKGHLIAVIHIFAYLRNHHNARMVFDPTYPTINHVDFEVQNWRTTYDNMREETPDNMPAPKGKEFTMTAYVDADHAGDKVTRRSRTGFITYLNMAPIYWMSKKQGGVETSSFGSEFTALKHCTEYIRGLRYKLRMMGIPVNDPTYVYADNKSVLYNSTLPESTLKKKSNSIAYHYVREGVAKGEWMTTYINTKENPSDILTKPLFGGDLRNQLVRKILWDI